MVAFRFPGLKTEDRAMLRRVADVLRPPGRDLPSVWAARSCRLPPEMTEHPGPYKPDFFPWNRAIMDARRHFPHKRGAIIKKAAQIGVTTALLVELAGSTLSYRGRTLYIISTKSDAAKFVSEKFNPIIRENAELKGRFEQGKEDDRAILCSKPYPGGRVDFVGAGSPGQVSSWTYGQIYLDEFEQCEDVFNKEFGDVFGFAMARQRALRGKKWINVFSHPRRRGQGIDKLFTELSDEHDWCFDCPGCGHAWAPRLAHIHYTATLSDGRTDPSSAELRCPGCQRAISDVERSVAVWDKDRGGTGRFFSRLTAEEQARRPFVGLAVHGLCDPYKTVVGYARQLAACTTEEKRMTFVNLEMGEDYERSDAVITVDVLNRILQPADAIVVPGGTRGARYLVAGCDVQAPRSNPTHYVAGVAYCADGMAYVVDLSICSGFAAFNLHLARLKVAVAAVAGQAGIGAEVGVRLAVRDTGWETGSVLDDCRGSMYGAGGRIIQHLPVKYVPHLNADNPAVMAPDRKREHPTRKELGLLRAYYYLHRHTWVDRILRRIAEGRLVVLCRVPETFRAHLMSNMLRPVAKQHGMDQDRAEWWKPDEVRDDWLQSLAYAEAGAALELKLDTIHAMSEAELAGHAGTVRSGAQAVRRDDYISRYRNQGSWWNR